MESLYSLLTILGPILLGAVLLWAIFRNRQKRDPQSLAQTERGTRELYDQMDKESKAKDGEVR